ncbi:MAG: polyprenyl synthetase family protein [Rhodococcus sp.]|nr:polyprenyl synthetase family protein [Rhodococcus sp. (in: high G+C Gram-positive bacteria)]
MNVLFTSTFSGGLIVSAAATPLAARVQDTLCDFFSSRSALIDAVGGGYREAVSTLEAFVLQGGKRVRPAFAWAGWSAAGGDPQGADADAVLRVCSALELVQACALVHDDIIDASTTRRGFPTVHVSFAEQHRSAKWSGDPAHFGTSVAILLGDLALAWADDMVRESGISPEAAARIAPVWSAMRTEVLGGQFLDIRGEASADESIEAAMRVNRYKTAAYTIERPLHVGAALAGADDAVVDAYRRFGTDVGIAFQLRDDLLGVFGDPSVTGKPSGDDLRAGKRTVLLALALSRADRDDPGAARFLRDRLAAANPTSELSDTPRGDRFVEAAVLTDSDIDTMRGIITDVGAVEEIETRIDALTESALAALEGVASPKDVAATGTFVTEEGCITDAGRAELTAMALAMATRST